MGEDRATDDHYARPDLSRPSKPIGGHRQRSWRATGNTASDRPRSPGYRIDLLGNRWIEQPTGAARWLPGDLSGNGLTVQRGRIGFARESWDDGVRAARDMFSNPEPPRRCSAPMELSLQVLFGLRQLGIRVPTEVSLIGFDDAPWNPLLDPPLSAVASAPFRLGKLAALRLCRAIEHGSASPPA